MRSVSREDRRLSVQWDTFRTTCYVYRVQSSSFNGTVLYNHTSVYSIPVAINLVTSARLRMANSLASIYTYVWPWPEQKLLDEDASRAVLRMMLIVASALLVCVSSFGAELVKVRKVFKVSFQPACD